MKIAIIIVSDSASHDHHADKSGPALKNLLLESKTLEHVEIVAEKIVSDNKEEIMHEIRMQIIVGVTGADVILTTGGTGFAPRDVTPEATKPLLERECPGIVTALLMRSLQATPMAALTRLTAGISGHSLIINLPGSPKAVKECFEVLEPILKHAVQLIQNDKPSVASVHRDMQHNAQ